MNKTIEYCIISKKHLEEEVFSYLKKNRTLAIDSISLLDKLKLDICKHLRLNYREIEFFCDNSTARGGGG